MLFTVSINAICCSLNQKYSYTELPGALHPVNLEKCNISDSILLEGMETCRKFTFLGKNIHGH